MSAGMTTKRKALIGVVGVGLLVVVVDKLFIDSGPADAGAAPTSPQSPAAPTGASQPPSTPRASSDEPSVAMRVAALRSGPIFSEHWRADGFQPEPTWHEQMLGSKPRPDEPEPEPAFDLAKELAGVRVTSIMRTSNGEVPIAAVVAGRVVRVGDSVGPSTVREIRLDSIVLEAEGQRVTLRLPIGE